ncbi:hypothetical protein [Vreelandella titanicae]|uniref:Uncharacterized protein n=1 Tax=Vreelandella titanicae TaxID=664683 RepID=A0A558J1V8_9GAMM|nr:hypothetical protein [Halomonas titanicae]TVU87587.1 hypothetical protein FQP89_20790 [Halomonas titanicae]
MFDVLLKDIGGDICDSSSIDILASKNKSYIYNFYGSIKSIAESQINLDYLNIEKYIIEILAKGSDLELLNPITGASTRPFFSCTFGMSNFVFFSDNNYNNVWILGQTTCFVDLIWCEGKFYDVGFDFKVCYKNLNDAFHEKYFDLCEKSFNSSVGVVLKSSRPFHSVYDQCFWLWFLLQKNYNFQDLVILDEVSYLDLSFLLMNKKDLNITKKKRKGFIYFFPCFFSRNSYKKSIGESVSSYRTKDHIIKIRKINKYVKEFEDSLGSLYAADIEKDNDCFYLWIGVTGQKRSWIEQTIAYSKIIDFLSLNFRKIVVFVDGWTATHNSEAKKGDANDDKLIAEEIFTYLSCHRNMKFVSLIGLDYSKKISACQLVDFFISNAGSGSTVPLRFLRKPGVLHSNSALFTFPEIYPSSVKIINKPPYMTDVLDDTAAGASASTSYSICWRIVYENLVDSIMEVTGFKIKKSSDIQNINFSFAVNRIENKLGTEGREFPDIMREVALYFELTGNYNLAYEVVSLALKERPHGSFLFSKKKSYCQKLGFNMLSYKQFLNGE